MLIKQFTKDSQTLQIGIVALFKGEPGSGKTFNALSFPGPILVLDTEQRSSLVLQQLDLGDKEVYVSPVKTLEDMRTSINEFIEQCPLNKDPKTIYETGTIVIDSASSLQDFAQDEWSKKTGKTSVYPVTLWSEIYSILEEFILKLRSTKLNIVYTAQLKDEFVGDSKTGRKLADIYKRIPYWSDLIMDCAFDPVTSEHKVTVLKNGYGKEQHIEISPGFEGIKTLIHQHPTITSPTPHEQ